MPTVPETRSAVLTPAASAQSRAMWTPRMKRSPTPTLSAVAGRTSPSLPPSQLLRGGYDFQQRVRRVYARFRCRISFALAKGLGLQASIYALERRLPGGLKQFVQRQMTMIVSHPSSCS
jgi:hypothetical protein